MSAQVSFDRLVYFGDSLTDSGEFFALASQLLSFPLPSQLFGYDGQFSNGDVYADIAPQLLGIEVQNFAVGGARAVGVNPLGQTLASSPLALPDPDPALVAFDSNLSAQVSRFLSDATQAGGVQPGTAASIFIGLNDLNNFVPSSPAAAPAEAQQLVGDIITSILTNAGALAQAGVGTILINTLPPASFFQFADPILQALGDTVVAGLNQALVDQSSTLTALGVEVEVIDFAAIAAEIQADPSTFGFLTVSEQRFFGTGADPMIQNTPTGPVPFFPENPAVAGLDEDQFVFYDLLHPTTATHGVLGSFQAASLTSDTHFLGASDDRLASGRGEDLVLAGGGDDHVQLGNGNDIALGGLGNDRILGGNGNDVASGGSGDDHVNGGRGVDALAGGAGNDHVRGGSGDDVLIDSRGSDFLAGGRGDDAFFFTEADLIGGATGEDSDVIVGGRGLDTLFLALDDGSRALAEAELAAAGGGAVTFDSLNLTVRGVERFVFINRGDQPSELTGEQADALAAADLWGFV